MRFRSRWWLTAVVPVALIVALLLAGVNSASSAGQQAHPPTTRPGVVIVYGQDPAVAAAEASFGYYLHDQIVADIIRYVAAADLATYLMSLPPPPPPVAPAPAVVVTPRQVSPAPSSGGACGGATNGADQFIQRESGGNPYIINGGGTAASPYESGGRAWGCYQIMPGTWSGACSDLGYDPASQAQCASRLGLSAWNE